MSPFASPHPQVKSLERNSMPDLKQSGHADQEKHSPTIAKPLDSAASPRVAVNSPRKLVPPNAHLGPKYLRNSQQMAKQPLVLPTTDRHDVGQAQDLREGRKPRSRGISTRGQNQRGAVKSRGKHIGPQRGQEELEVKSSREGSPRSRAHERLSQESIDSPPLDTVPQDPLIAAKTRTLLERYPLPEQPLPYELQSHTVSAENAMEEGYPQKFPVVFKHMQIDETNNAMPESLVNSYAAHYGITDWLAKRRDGTLIWCGHPGITTVAGPPPQWRGDIWKRHKQAVKKRLQECSMNDEVWSGFKAKWEKENPRMQILEAQNAELQKQLKQAKVTSLRAKLAQNTDADFSSDVADREPYTWMPCEVSEARSFLQDKLPGTKELRETWESLKEALEKEKDSLTNLLNETNLKCKIQSEELKMEKENTNGAHAQFRDLAARFQATQREFEEEMAARAQASERASEGQGHLMKQIDELEKQISDESIAHKHSTQILQSTDVTGVRELMVKLNIAQKSEEYQQGVNEQLQQDIHTAYGRIASLEAKLQERQAEEADGLRNINYILEGVNIASANTSEPLIVKIHVIGDVVESLKESTRSIQDARAEDQKVAQQSYKELQKIHDSKIKEIHEYQEDLMAAAAKTEQLDKDHKLVVAQLTASRLEMHNGEIHNQWIQQVLWDLFEGFGDLLPDEELSVDTSSEQLVTAIRRGYESLREELATKDDQLFESQIEVKRLTLHSLQPDDLPAHSTLDIDLGNEYHGDIESETGKSDKDTGILNVLKDNSDTSLSQGAFHGKLAAARGWDSSAEGDYFRTHDIGDCMIQTPPESKEASTDFSMLLGAGATGTKRTALSLGNIFGVDLSALGTFAMPLLIMVLLILSHSVYRERELWRAANSDTIAMLWNQQFGYYTRADVGLTAWLHLFLDKLGAPP